MIGDHHELIARPELALHAPDHLVAALVHLQDRVAKLLGVAPAIRGMLAVEVAEEHVLQAIGAVEHADDGAIARLPAR